MPLFSVHYLSYQLRLASFRGLPRAIVNVCSNGAHPILAMCELTSDIPRVVIYFLIAHCFQYALRDGGGRNVNGEAIIPTGESDQVPGIARSNFWKRKSSCIVACKTSVPLEIRYTGRGLDEIG